MQKKCPKCGKNDMRVWDAMNGKMFLQCKACHWTSKDLPWTREAKEEWNHLNPGWESPPKKPEIECNTGYTTIYRCPSCKQLFAGKQATDWRDSMLARFLRTR